MDSPRTFRDITNLVSDYQIEAVVSFLRRFLNNVHLLLLSYSGQRVPETCRVFSSKRITLPPSCTHINLNASAIPVIPANLTASIDIVRLRQWQLCGWIRFTYHSICFDGLNLQPLRISAFIMKVDETSYVCFRIHLHLRH